MPAAEGSQPARADPGTEEGHPPGRQLRRPHQEGGGVAAERQETFPYFFWKPPTHDADRIPAIRSRSRAVSPNHVDWEIELGVIIGRRCQARHREGRPELRRRLHGLQRHLRPQVPDQPRPQGTRQGQLLRLAARQMARHASCRWARACVSAAASPDPQKLPMKLHGQRPGDAGRQHRADDLPGGGPRRDPVELRHAGAGRHHLHRHAQRRRHAASRRST